MPLDALPSISSDELRETDATRGAHGQPALGVRAPRSGAELAASGEVVADAPSSAPTLDTAPSACSWCSTPGVYCRGLCRRCYRKALTVECDGVTLPPTARMGRPPSHGHHLVDLVMMAGPDQKRLVMDALRREFL